MHHGIGALLSSLYRTDIKQSLGICPTFFATPLMPPWVLLVPPFNLPFDL